MTSDEVVQVFAPIDGAFFAELVKAAAELADELRFSVAPAGVSCVGFDPGRAAFVEWRVGAEHFTQLPLAASEFDVRGPAFAAAFKGVKDKDGVVVNVRADAAFVNVASGATRVRRKVARVEVHGFPSQRVKVDDAKDPLDAVVAAPDFAAAVKEVADVAESCSVQAFAESLTLAGEQDLRESRFAVTPVGDGERVRGSGVARYAGEYLVRVAALAKQKAFRTVALRWGENRPLHVVYELGGVWVHYVVAPRVEND